MEFSAIEIAYEGWVKMKRKCLNEKWYDILENRDAVAALVEDSVGKVLLVRQFRPSIFQETWEIPAGVVDKMALSYEEIMSEELLEEAGLTLAADKLQRIVTIIPEIGLSGAELTIYYVKLDFAGENQQIVNDDVKEARWFSMEELQKCVLSGEIKDNKTVLAFAYLQLGNMGG
ncbi:MAG: NUDIX hydrolase [Clostridia bacterium]